jgi:hypothetical protein
MIRICNKIYLFDENKTINKKDPETVLVKMLQI